MELGFELPNLFRLDERIAVVTGAGQGLGKAIATGLAAFGAALAIVDINEEKAEQTASELVAHGQRAIAVSCDVADEKQVQRMTQKVVDEWGRIDILVNNAGIAHRASIYEVRIEDWRRVLDVNLVGGFLCAREAGRVMEQQQRGSIINIASIAGFSGRGTQNTAYVASKAGVINLTRALAVQWAKSGIRVNALAPAEMDTPLLDELKRIPGALEERLQRIPMNRIGQPRELIGPVVFLASDASSFVTGHTLPVDGGALAV